MKFCPYCGMTFTPNKKRRKYCSIQCKGKAHIAIEIINAKNVTKKEIMEIENPILRREAIKQHIHLFEEVVE